MMSGGSRGLKVLGLRVVDIIASLFPTTKESAGGQSGGKVVRSEFFGFWRQIASPEDSTLFLESILQQVLPMLDAKGNTTHTVSINTLINTIAFATVHLPFNPKSRAITAFLTNWNDRIKDPTRDPSRDYPAVRDVVRLLAVRVSDNKESALQDFLGPLVVGASTLHNAQEVQSMNALIRAPAYDETDVGSNEFSFALSYLCKLVLSGGTDAQVLVLSTLINKSLTLPQQLKMNPRVAESTLFALLHMLRVILSSNTVTNSAFLRKAILILQRLLLWPEPWGSVARGVVESFQSELLFPGWNRRQTLAAEAQVVDYAGAEKEPGYRHLKPLFYFHDAKDLSSMATLNVIDAAPFSSAKTVKPVATSADPSGGLALPAPIEALVVLQALVADAALPPNGADTLFSSIQRLSASKISHLAASLRQTEQEVADAPADAPRIRAAAADAMVAEITAAAAAAGGAGPTLMVPVQPQPPGRGVGVGTFCPPLPCIEHVRIGVELKPASEDLDVKTNTLESTDAAALASYCGYTYARLLSLARAYSSEANSRNASPREVRIVIAGGDVLLQHVAAAHALLQANQPTLLRGLVFRFFVAPVSRNGLAGYISRHDSWYFRHVYAPLRSSAMVIPWLRDDETELRSVDDPVPVPPTAFLRDCLEHYARDATGTLFCHMHQLEGFSDARAEPGTGESITFLQRVEVGLPVAVEEFRSRHHRPASWRVEDALKDKTFQQPPPVDLAVRFTRLDLAGQRSGEISEDAVSFQSLLFAAVPRKGDAVHPPNPASPALELHAQLHRHDQSKVKKSLLSVEPKQHISDAVIASASGAKFRVLVDGAFHGPYAVVRLSPAKEPFAVFPVQTFAPFGDSL